MTVVKPITRTVGPAGAGFDVRVDELVLHGFRPGDRHEIAAVVEEELARLLAGRPAAPRWLGPGSGDRAVPVLDAGTFELPPDARPRVVGTRLAQALHRALVAGPGGRDGARDRAAAGGAASSGGTAAGWGGTGAIP